MPNRHSVANAPLAKPQRSQLEATVKAAREVAEKAARASLAHLAVGEAKVPDYLSDELKPLRRRLRAHGRALGDLKAKDESQGLQHLVWEVAYEHWHRMLFARFLAENGLLMWEPGAPVSIDDCRDMVDSHPEMAMSAKSHWELAGKLAARMLPQVFKPQSPVFELTFAPEHQRELEKLLAALPPEVFKASDSLGWVYQFWQAKRKDEVNASEVKIGADELPAVTQLFTEPYMVDFLLHNSLGAWWVTRHAGQACPVPLTYLRTLDDGTPAAGKFDGWPNRLSEFKLLDPCCGSGHFLVAAFLMLVPMRMTSEGLSARDAVDAVLADNLHGLELDARCVEIAVFALALAAWRYQDEGGNALGVRAEMPAPQVACCGLKVAARPQDWEALVPDAQPNAALLRQELRLLHSSFAQAPLLGSLLDPARSIKNDLATSSFETLRGLLERALATEGPATLWGEGQALNDDAWDLALTARGLLDAARLLDGRYHLVVTNVPYLKRGKQNLGLRAYCETHFDEAKDELATVFLSRSCELLVRGGAAFVVCPQAWTFHERSKKIRINWLRTFCVRLYGALGANAFETISGEVVNVGLFGLVNEPPTAETTINYVSCESGQTAQAKAEFLQTQVVARLPQLAQLINPDSRIISQAQSEGAQISTIAATAGGLQTFDKPRFVAMHWESQGLSDGWLPLQSTPDSTAMFAGCQQKLLWEDGSGKLAHYMNELAKTGYKSGVWRAGVQVWGRPGVIFRLMGMPLACARYLGYAFDNTTGVLLPNDPKDVDALWLYCSSPEYSEEIQKIDKKVAITNGNLAKVPIALAKWKALAASKFPEGIPKPYTDDPTQWLFHGHPHATTEPLQVAVARLLGYRWPAEADPSIELSGEARNWISRCEDLADIADDDGIVCLSSVRGEKAAHDRLLALLIAAWETVERGSWKLGLLDKLLADVDCADKGLEFWLRDKFFEQHAKLFQHRPFIWHVWDGLKDGFGALVNYHKLDAKNLERLIHTYLGDWIRQQETGVRDGVDGASTRLAAAQDLKRRLELIQEGDKPYDIFVRWKPLAEQSSGWNPDPNDGVRLNIRPFMTAEVLRHNKKPKLNVGWDKDRGKDVESAPWFKLFEGERINDHHLSLAQKSAGRGGM